jgi:hypothetical protein
VDNATTRAPAAGEPGGADEAVQIPWDPNEYRAMVCRKCGRPRVFRRPRLNSSFHFMLALGTIGLWLPVWAVAILIHALKPWNCTFCGSRQERAL